MNVNLLGEGSGKQSLTVCGGAPFTQGSLLIYSFYFR